MTIMGRSFVDLQAGIKKVYQILIENSVVSRQPLGDLKAVEVTSRRKSGTKRKLDTDGKENNVEIQRGRNFSMNLRSMKKQTSGVTQVDDDQPLDFEFLRQMLESDQ